MFGITAHILRRLTRLEKVTKSMSTKIDTVNTVVADLGVAVHDALDKIAESAAALASAVQNEAELDTVIASLNTQIAAIRAVVPAAAVAVTVEAPAAPVAAPAAPVAAPAAPAA